jgi:putative PIN family toxin of toxin-antitoxin system
LVLDTDVVVAGMRSPRGASAAILGEVRMGRVVLALTVALALEYEAVCLRPEHRLAAGLSRQEAVVFVDAVLAMAEPVETHYRWRPQLRDPADEMVLEAAINAEAVALVTFNRKDFGDVPMRFGIDILLPRDAIRRIRL